MKTVVEPRRAYRLATINKIYFTEVSPDYIEGWEKDYESDSGSTYYVNTKTREVARVSDHWSNNCGIISGSVWWEIDNLKPGESQIGVTSLTLANVGCGHWNSLLTKDEMETCNYYYIEARKNYYKLQIQDVKARIELCKKRGWIHEEKKAQKELSIVEWIADTGGVVDFDGSPIIEKENNENN